MLDFVLIYIVSVVLDFAILRYAQDHNMCKDCGFDEPISPITNQNSTKIYYVPIANTIILMLCLIGICIRLLNNLITRNDF